MCPDVRRAPYSRVVFPSDQFLKCESQQSFINPSFGTFLDSYDERSSAILLNCERAAQQLLNDPDPFGSSQYVESDSPSFEEVDTGWMSDVFKDLPVISQELAQLPVSEISIAPPNYELFSPSIALSINLLDPDEDDFEQHESQKHHRVCSVVDNIKHSVTVSENTNSQVQKAPSLLPSLSSLSENAVITRSLRVRGSKNSDRRQTKRHKMTKENSYLASEQVEHVMRERQRRDDMSAKIAILEGLLPPCSKRDRASIVHDSIQYVKSLQQGVEELQKKLEVSKKAKTIRKASATLPRLSLEKACRMRSVCSNGPHTDNLTRSSGISGTEGKKLYHMVEFYIQLEGCSEPARLAKSMCRLDYLSSTMRALEKLDVDVIRCSVTKMFDHFMCVVIVKPRHSDDSLLSSISIATSIQGALAV